MTWDPNVPYNALAPLPPPLDVETKRVLKSTIEARAALAALNQAAQRIPNPAVLLNALPLLEAQASSEIENIVTTADELFAAAADEGLATRPETKETLRYREALTGGVDLVRARGLSIATVTQVCSIIQGKEMAIRSLPGTFIGNPSTRTAVYTPPDGRLTILDKLSDWERFASSERVLDPLVNIALSHYQFEAIHPFADGNGRTGRVIAILQLIDRGLLSSPILYLSRYIIREKDEYYRLLKEVTASALWEDWVVFFLRGIREMAESTIHKIDGIRTLQAATQETMRGALSSGANADLLDVLFEQPFCRIQDVITRCDVSRPTATKWLQILVDAQVLSSVKLGKHRIFINHRLFELLTRDDVPPAPQDATLF
ncbi:Fic family protein [Microcella alkaliphila]|uniref:Fido domain-containing protein n=1 Tax=Microcella alkaliphila TaxID=279828 RepID=A0A0U5BAC6_9MICO|nr:Fic/DOC family N-terminal domain-containing protein [Microcella alkaliphila]BAU31215.1 uncharacterized protein MalAC0309_0340 [Microcella alkaliphila]